MKIGVPKEIKTHEYRVGINPTGVKQLVAANHKVLVQAGAGLSSGFTDETFTAAGAEIVADPGRVWGDSDMVIKVKEPLPSEFQYFREGPGPLHVSATWRRSPS